MKKVIYIVLTISLLIFLIIEAKELYDKKKVINEMAAFKLTDTNFQGISTNIRKITIEYLERNNLEPEEYFVTKYSKLQFSALIGSKKKAYHDVYTLNLLRYSALKELSKKEILPDGAAGKEGDDINIVYDKNLKKVLGIIVSE